MKENKENVFTRNILTEKMEKTFDDISDLEYFQERLFASLRIPTRFFDYEL